MIGHCSPLFLCFSLLKSELRIRSHPLKIDPDPLVGPAVVSPAHVGPVAVDPAVQGPWLAVGAVSVLAGLDPIGPAVIPAHNPLVQVLLGQVEGKGTG